MTRHAAARGAAVLTGVVLGAVSLTLAVESVEGRQTGQQPPPQFRAGAATVPVYATVTDRQRGIVLDLKKEDFEVRDNGKLQEVVQFTTDAQPLSALILIDGSSSMMPVFNTVLDAANGFIVRMLPADRTAIASFADLFQMRQKFTADRDELLGHLQDQFNIRVAGETRLWDALVEGATTFQNEKNRRVILLISDGKNWSDPRAAALNTANRALGAALDHDVMIYTIAMWTTYQNVQEAPDPAVERLSTETGGGFVQVREADDMSRTLSQISKELHEQYVLGFVPQQLDGKTHKLEVKVKRPGLNVRARRSYVAPAPGGTPAQPVRR